MDTPDQTRQNEHGDLLQVAGLMAHQLKSPIAAATSLLNAVLGEYAGPLTPQQKRMLNRMNECLGESLEAMRRMLEIVTPASDEEIRRAATDVGVCLQSAELAFRQAMRSRNIALTLDVHLQPACVRMSKAALTEVMNALLSNAVKYTPDNGSIRIRVGPAGESEAVRISVSDSGIGVPEENRERIFEPFFRAATARSSDRPGVGLGLAFVHSVVSRFGGAIRVGKSDLGGAEFILDLPRAVGDEAGVVGHGEESSRFRVVIVGGVAAGPKAASKIIRLMPDADVTVIEKGKFLSYAGCGLPYYVSETVREAKEWMASALGGARDAVFFQKVKNVHVRSLTEVVDIDRTLKRVKTRDVINSAESWVSYDKLILATGASPIIPAIPGVRLRGVFTLHGVQDAEGIKAALASGRARDVVIIGGGLIGVEMTEALAARGCRVTIVELESQILHILDWEMARLVERQMESKGVKVMTHTRVLAIEGRADDGERVTQVVTDGGTVPVDMVILAVGVRPNVGLAEKAGLEISEETGAVRVDDHLRTSDPDIHAVGDCVECRDLLTGRPCYVPLGSTANKQGRIAAINVCGGDSTFPGVLGSTVCKVFDHCVARTGLTETAARSLGYDVVTALVPAPDRAHYMPDARMLMLKLVAEAGTGRLLGAQAVGPGNGVKRIDVAAMAITAGMTVHDLATPDLCYAPPYAPVLDNLITAANVVQNKLNGDMVGITPMEVHGKLSEGQDFVLLDLRTPQEFEGERLPKSVSIPLAARRGRLHELPRDKEIVTFCNLSLRGYEGALILRAAGFKDVKVLDGGLVMWPYERE